jgi:hypothetical protein
VDDRTDDCACGAMLSLATRRKFRKLRFQMIADKDAFAPLVELLRMPGQKILEIVPTLA